MIEDRLNKDDNESGEKPDPKTLELFGVKPTSSAKKRGTTRDATINPISLYDNEKVE